MTSNNTTQFFFAQSEHNSKVQQLTMSKFHQNRRACNYIKEYYGLQDAFNIPEISIANFYQKIHKLRSLIVEKHQNIFEFMQKQYPLSPMVTLNQTLCSNYMEVNKKIEQTDTASFSFRQHLDQQTKSLYFGRAVEGRRMGYAVYAEYTIQNRQNYSLSCFYQGFFDQNLKEGFGVEWRQHLIYIGNFNKDKANSNEVSVILYQTGDIYMGGVRNNKKHGKGAFFKLKKKLNQYFKYQASRKPLEYQYLVIGRWQKNFLSSNSDFLMKKNIKQLLQMSLFDVEANLLIQNHSIYCGGLIQRSDVSYGREIHFTRNNKGAQYFVNGDLYQGQYEQNKPHGNGHYYWSTQEEYMGEFKEGLRSGNGRWIGPNGEQFEGQYKYDKRNGYGIYKWPNGDIYEGEFKGDIRNGLGRMSWNNGQIYVGNWQDGLQHGVGQIQVQLRCTNLHKKILFERGYSVIKKEESQEAQVQALMKSKFQYKSRVKEIKQHRRTSYKKEHERQQTQNKISEKRQKTQHKDSQKGRGKSLGQLRISKKLNFMQDQKRQKTQHKSSSIIDKSFFDYRRQLTLHQSWQNRQNKSTYIAAGKATANCQELKCQSQLQPSAEKQISQEIKLSEPMQINQDIRRSENHQLNLAKKLVIKKKKHLFRDKKPSETPLQMGDTLLKPIKWVNFKESWQKS